MKACHEKETASRARVETVYVKPVWEEWSEENRKRVRELIESLRREGGEEERTGPPEADFVLAEIRRRNRERGDLCLMFRRGRRSYSLKNGKGTRSVDYEKTKKR